MVTLAALWLPILLSAVIAFIASTVAFAGYSLAVLHDWIWYSRSAGYTLKTMFDGLVYALLTGGVFGWLWPH